MAGVLALPLELIDDLFYRSGVRDAVALSLTCKALYSRLHNQGKQLRSNILKYAF